MYPKLSAILSFTSLKQALHAKSLQRDHLELGVSFIRKI